MLALNPAAAMLALQDGGEPLEGRVARGDDELEAHAVRDSRRLASIALAFLGW